MALQATENKTASVPSGRAAQRRRVQRDRIWPDAEAVVYLPGRGGWSQIPRTIPMIAALIDTLGGKEHAGRLYITLWGHAYSDGFVEISDPALIALEAGYRTNRAERTFSERLRTLEELGFVRTAPLGTRAYGYALLLDPHVAVARLRAKKDSTVSDQWWTAFIARCSTAGIDVPNEDG